MMFRAALLFSVACAALSTGCAFTNVDVHPPESMPPKLTAAAGPGRLREVVVVAPFADARDMRDLDGKRDKSGRCGMQMNGYRMDTADVICNVPPGRWLADALAVTLTNQGYRVLDAATVPGPSTIIVHGAVRKLFLEPYDGFFTRTVEGDFSVHLVVTTGSGLHAERTFFVKGTEEHIGSFESVFQAAADDATERIAFAMAGALGNLLDKYPELGAPQAKAPVAVHAPAVETSGSP